MRSLLKRKESLRQKGIVFLLSAGMGVTASLMVIQEQIKDLNKANYEQLASVSGSQIGQYTNALREYVASQVGAAGTPVDQAGVDWLKDSGCGGLATNPAGGYLPCSFAPQTPLGQAFATAFVRAGSVLTATVSMSQIQLIMKPNYTGVLASKVAEYANSNPSSLSTPASGTFFEHQANPGVNLFAAGAELDPNFGVIQSQVANNPVTDAWLRTDGSNQMLANLDMGFNRIDNAEAIEVRWDGGTPFIDFSNDLGSDFDARMILNNDNELEVTGADLKVADVLVSGNTALGYGATDSYLTDILTTIDVRLPKYSHVGTYLAWNGDIVVKPACGGIGTPKIVVVPAYIDMSTLKETGGFVSQALQYSTAQFKALDNGGSWTVNAFSTVYSGTTWDSPNNQAIVNIYCDYI